MFAILGQTPKEEQALMNDALCHSPELQQETLKPCGAEFVEDH